MSKKLKLIINIISTIILGLMTSFIIFKYLEYVKESKDDLIGKALTYYYIPIIVVFVIFFLISLIRLIIKLKNKNKVVVS